MVGGGVFCYDSCVEAVQDCTGVFGSVSVGVAGIIVVPDLGFGPKWYKDEGPFSYVFLDVVSSNRNFIVQGDEHFCKLGG